MKKLIFVLAFVLLTSALLSACETENETASDSTASQNSISKEMAFEGVNNYCHIEYDWDIAKDNPEIMYVEMGEETETEYQVVFRSYTGSFVYFYVNKSNGTTRLVEYVPTLNIEEDAGTINIYDYLKSDENTR